MIISKIVKSEKYSIIDNRYLNDVRLSIKAVGLLTYLLSKPKDWKPINGEIGKRFDIGRTAIQAIWRELVTAGYAERVTKRNDKGHIHSEYIIYENPDLKESEPDVRSTDVRFPDIGSPDIGQPDILVNTKLPNTKIENTYLPITKTEKKVGRYFFSLVSKYEIKSLIENNIGRKLNGDFEQWYEYVSERNDANELSPAERWIKSFKGFTPKPEAPKPKPQIKEYNPWLNLD